MNAAVRSDDDPSRPDSAVLRSFFDGAPFQMGITELTPDHDLLLVSVNPATALASGLSVEQLQGRRISELGLNGPRKGVALHDAGRTLLEQSLLAPAARRAH
jgi:hypothetical protein